MSIKPEYANLIKSGVKRVEFRKTALRHLDRVIFYEIKPVQACTCETRVICHMRDKPNKIWEQCRTEAGIDRKTFDEYIGRKTEVTALFLGDVIVFDEPKPLAEFGLDTHPQSFVYLDNWKRNEGKV